MQRGSKFSREGVSVLGHGSLSSGGASSGAPGAMDEELGLDDISMLEIDDDISEEYLRRRKSREKDEGLASGSGSYRYTCHKYIL